MGRIQTYFLVGLGFIFSLFSAQAAPSSWGKKTANTAPVVKSIPTLEREKSIEDGKFENGLCYTLWPVKEESGSYYVGLLQADTLRYSQKIQHVQKAFAADSVLYDVFCQVRDSINAKPRQYGTNNSRLLVVGDFDKKDFLSRAKPLSVICPQGKSTQERQPFPHRDSIHLSYRTQEIGDSTTLIVLNVLGTSFPEKLLNTIIPTVSERSWFIMKEVLNRRLKRALAQADIPVGKILFLHQLRTGEDNSERFNIKLAIPTQDSSTALQHIFRVIHEVRKGETTPNEIKCAAQKFLISQYDKQQQTEFNDEKLNRLTSYYLYQTDLAPKTAKTQFFTRHKFNSEQEKKRFDRFAAHYFKDIPYTDAEMTAKTGDAADWTAAPKLNFEDTCYFAEESEKKIKLIRSIKEGTSGGTMSFYENDTKTIYKKMDCGKRVYFSFVFDGGFSLLEHPQAAAYVEDVFAAGSVNGYPMEDFLSLLAADETDIRFSADFSAIRLYGSCREERVSSLMKALVALTGHFTVNPEIYPYLSRCEKVSSYFYQNSEDKVYAELFPQLHPDFPWTEKRSNSAPSEEILEDAARMIRESFRANKNSTLFLCGNLREKRMQAKLQRFMGQFHCETRPRHRIDDSMLTMSGMIRKGSSDAQKSGMIVSSFDYSSGQDALICAKVALSIFGERLRDALTPLGIRCRLSDQQRIHPKENLELTIGFSSAPEEVFALFEQCLDDLVKNAVSEETLKRERHKYECRATAQEKSPFYWNGLVYQRIVYGKDYRNNQAKCLKELSAAALQQFFQQWKNAGRVEVIYKKWDTDQKQIWNTDPASYR